MTLAIAHNTRAMRGERVSGDAVVVREERDVTLFAVVDALGHGEVAGEAAARAVAFLEAAPLGGVRDLMTGLHRALRGSRGASATLCLLRGERLEGCGVGNVELRSRGTRVPAVLTAGILGSHHGNLRVFSTTLARGDRLALFSDGVSRTLSLDERASSSVAQACPALFDAFATDGDDATLLLVEVLA